MKNIPPARHDLLPSGYAFGSIQTTRGCPLNCSFCSVTAFNGFHHRTRPIEDVVCEFKAIQEKHVLVVDDNLIGTMEHTFALIRFNPNLAFEIYYDFKSAPQAALLRAILTSKYSNIPSAKIVFAPCL